MITRKQIMHVYYKTVHTFAYNCCQVSLLKKINFNVSYTAASLMKLFLSSSLENFTFILSCIVIYFLNNQPDAPIFHIYSVIKLYMFQASSLPVIRSFLLYIRHWLVSCMFLMTVGTVIKICMKLTSGECPVENSWWWAEKMPETCRVS
jgi:hypothetical protein